MIMFLDIMVTQSCSLTHCPCSHRMWSWCPPAKNSLMFPLPPQTEITLLKEAHKALGVSCLTLPTILSATPQLPLSAGLCLCCSICQECSSLLLPALLNLTPSQSSDFKTTVISVQFSNYMFSQSYRPLLSNACHHHNFIFICLITWSMSVSPTGP